MLKLQISNLLVVQLKKQVNIKNFCVLNEYTRNVRYMGSD
jgi:hypothetical protein